jgi:hypothetical protein
MAAKGIRNPTGKPHKDQYEPAPDFKKSPHSGPGVGGGGDKMSSDKPLKGPRGKK